MRSVGGCRYNKELESELELEYQLSSYTALEFDKILSQYDNTLFSFALFLCLE